MSAPVVVFAIGNPSRGDDALGPLLAQRFLAWLEESGRGGNFVLVEDFQLQVEHTLDLEGRALALFIDAGTGTPPPFSFRRIQAASGYGHTTHALAPEALLQVYRQALDMAPPPAFVLCVRGESFELGDGLSPAAARHLEAALALLMELSGCPGAEDWDKYAGIC